MNWSPHYRPESKVDTTLIQKERAAPRLQSSITEMFSAETLSWTSAGLGEIALIIMAEELVETSGPIVGTYP
jgi:hypothetical protein